MKPGPIAVVIDDEIQMRRLLRLALESDSYQVFDAETGTDGLRAVVHHRPDVVLLDLGLPDITGFDVLQRLREWTPVPVLILSVQDAFDDKVRALDLGADDYVTKPFNTAELLARLRVIQRRAANPEKSSTFTLGPLQIDYAAHLVHLDGAEISLTATEYAVLRTLAQHAGKIVTQKQLLTQVWGDKAGGQAQYLRVYINHLRNKLEPEPSSIRLIKTEPGIGYRLITG
ncbi:MAG: response regulator transcription factor [Chthoniobacterales bacterium]